MILASGSPRRAELLKKFVSEFTVQVSEVDEESLTVADPWETAEQLALAKAVAVYQKNKSALVIGGDTVVAVELANGFRQLAKPTDPHDAGCMLSSLSGIEHLVITGIGIASPKGQCSGHSTTRVRFRPLDKVEIERYVETGEPMDKAGAYAIQGGAAGFVESIDGPIDNVIGLPLDLAERLIKKNLSP